MLQKEKIRTILKDIFLKNKQENDKWKILYKDIIKSDENWTALVHWHILLMSKITEDIFSIEFLQILNGWLSWTYNILKIEEYNENNDII